MLVMGCQGFACHLTVPQDCPCWSQPRRDLHLGKFTLESRRDIHSFDKSGTYFVTLRAASQRDGDGHTPFARVQNLGRARVVVR
jgi:hypothetical protein